MLVKLGQLDLSEEDERNGVRTLTSCSSSLLSVLDHLRELAQRTNASCTGCCDQPYGGLRRTEARHV